MKHFFQYTFLIEKKTLFEVYNDKYFATSCAVFNHTNTDFNRCGQCQDGVLPPGPAREFWKKWDPIHLSILTDEQATEIKQDIEKLKEKYHWIPSCHFPMQQELVRLKLKK